MARAARCQISHIEHEGVVCCSWGCVSLAAHAVLWLQSHPITLWGQADTGWPQVWGRTPAEAAKMQCILRQGKLLCSKEPGGWYFSQLAVTLIKGVVFGRRLRGCQMCVKGWAFISFCHARVLWISIEHIRIRTAYSLAGQPHSVKTRHTVSNSTSITLHFKSSLEKRKWRKNILDAF